jgi:hypothetical protein
VLSARGCYSTDGGSEARGGSEKREELRLKLSCAVKNCENMNLSFMNLIEQALALDEQFTNDWIIQLRNYSSPLR